MAVKNNLHSSSGVQESRVGHTTGSVSMYRINSFAYHFNDNMCLQVASSYCTSTLECSDFDPFDKIQFILHFG